MDNKKKEKKMFAGSKVSVASVTITSIILAVLLIVSIFATVVFSARAYDVKDGEVNVYKLQSKIYTSMIVKAMPKSIEGKDNGRPINFYIEVNDKYDSTKDDPVEQYRVYYFNADGEKRIAANGIYRGSTEEMYPLVGFFIAGMDNLKTLKAVVKVVVVLTIIAVVGFAIYLIYLLYALFQDRKYSASYQEQKKNKKNNKNVK